MEKAGSLKNSEENNEKAIGKNEKDNEIISGKEESEGFRIFKKAIIVFVSIFLMFLFLSYFLLGNNIFDILASRSSSFTASNGRIIFGGGTITFQEEAYQNLLEIYNENQQHEFKACLMGYKSGKNYFVEKIEAPKIISQDFSSVRAEPCREGTIIDLHSHPYKSCYLSVHDLTTLKYVKAANKDAFLGVMCEPDRFNFYGYD
ncbi:hypothetical protein J4212_05385 [Candidatus Woesearchaeota archaeon]|nr:hypothetical protein [Candidatus Woesearchaeota archaeon]